MFSDREVAELSAYVNDIATDVLGLDGVVGIGVGLIGKGADGRLGIKVLVDKSHKAKITPANLNLTKDFQIEFVNKPKLSLKVGNPKTYNDGSLLKFDLTDWTHGFEPRVYDGRYDPLLGGSRIQPAGSNFLGTFGGTVFGIGSTQPLGLTNWHVADNGNATPVGNPIFQPIQSSSNQIGACVAASLGRVRTGWIDAALIQLNGTRQMSQSMIGINGEPTQRAAAARLGMKVIKSGRTTEVTRGKVDAVAYATTIDYGGVVGTVNYSNQILLRADPQTPNSGQVSNGGDSGSIWLESSTNRAIGLNFAGELSTDPDDRAIANPIFAVLNNFGVRFEPYPFPIYRWWNPSTTDHFYCQDAGGELAPIVGYVFEGTPWGLFAADEPDTTPLYRWWREGVADHFYTTDPTGELAPHVGYVPEGDIGRIRRSPRDGLVALHRWWHGEAADHFYTTDPTGELAPSSGYAYEGIVGYVEQL
ncbi:hypothetical protein GYN07_09000 [Rhizobium leguminosarum bv. viciae 248]|uniref:hypothetical protein n=1 Tax=Rhizobium leguminosarum TaxID=384 RepID=UPI00036434EF|nr:hypothetical protein [Rhizobium leguminosarum]QHW24457.1 hypothetical protein GYN07_09000 [Rhizobium leguminosarum bv. viciae 248]